MNWKYSGFSVHNCVRIAIEKDISLLGEIRDEHLFSRFFQLLSALSSQEINYSQVGRELGIDPKTAQAWLTISYGVFTIEPLPEAHNTILNPFILKHIFRK